MKYLLVILLLASPVLAETYGDTSSSFSTDRTMNGSYWIDLEGTNDDGFLTTPSSDTLYIVTGVYVVAKKAGPASPTLSAAMFYYVGGTHLPKITVYYSEAATTGKKLPFHK